MTLIMCRTCKIDKCITEFYPSMIKSKRCINCHTQAKKKTYIKHKHKVKIKTDLYRQNNRKMVNEWNKKSKNRRATKLKLLIQVIKHSDGCSICNENRHSCLDFHHLDKTTKYQTVAKMISHVRNLNLIKNEIEKCTILCSNCHRKHHFIKYPKNRKLNYVLNIKKSSKCYLCPEKTPCCLDFHHLFDKIETISIMSKAKGYTIRDITDEIQKCIILCSNCHRLLHAGEITLPDDVTPIKLAA